MTKQNRLFRTLSFLAVALAFATAGTKASGQAPRPGMVEFFALGKIRTGMPLLKATSEMLVLGRDGWMHTIDPSDPATKLRSLEGRYQPISVTEFRNELRAEYGKRFEVVATKDFLVVQPEGRGNRWPKLFEQSHRAFSSYMTKRGVKVRNGRFPMVAVVLPDEREMYMEFKKLGIDMTRVAGVYSGESNRVITHDGGRSSSIAATVRHEAAHQSAFNSGVHSRLSDTPRWISEGIGQMFEPAGMTDARGGAQLRDRVNLDSFGYLKRSFSGRNDTRYSDAVMQLVSDNTLFESKSQVEQAYAVSWSMMFYLAEREPDVFAELLNHTASRPPFREYERTERLKDFERIVGCKTFEFSKKVSWFVDSL